MTRRERFCEEYLVDLNATAAAQRAGYSAKTAYAQGSRLLRNVEVKARIDAAIARRGRKLDITAHAVLQELAKLAFFDVRTLVRADGTMKDLCELDDVTAAAISGFEVVTGKDGAHTRPVLRKIRLADKGVALERLGKHLGIFEGSGDGPSDRLDELIAAFQAGPVPSGWTISTDESTIPPNSRTEPHEESDIDKTEK